MASPSHEQKWIVVADNRAARLFACQRTPSGALRLKQSKSIQNRHEFEHDRGRPILAGGSERTARSGARAAPHAVSEGHGQEEEQRRFAREVASWLSIAQHHPGVHRVTLFAPARFLGLLRSELGTVSGAPTDLREAELTRLSEHELASHPAILSATSGS